MHIYINIKNGNDRIWSLNTCSINVNGHIRLIIYASHRGKRMTRVRNESQVITCTVWNIASQFQISYWRRTLKRKRKMAGSSEKTRYASPYPEERALENELLRGIYDDAAQNFGTVTHADSRTENMRRCRPCVRFRAYVCMWGVRLFHLFSSHRPAHQIPTLSAFSHILFLLFYSLFFKSTFPMLMSCCLFPARASRKQ